jgi:hypothetical protein
MWTGNVAFSELDRKSKWKVEFYCSKARREVKAAYPCVKLGELLKERGETLDPQAFPEHVFNYVGLEHVESITGDLIGFEPKLGSGVKSRSKVFREGDILYGRLRPYLNKVLLVDERLKEGICSGEFYVFVPDQKRVCPSVARVLVSSGYVQDVVAGRLTGAALPRLQLDELLEVEVPLPPLDVQGQYADFIANRDRERREMAARVRALPELLLREIVSSLESGKKPSTGGLAVDSNDGQCFDNPLPEGIEVGRGRKKPESMQHSFFRD